MRSMNKKEDSSSHEATGMMRWLLTYADVITLLLIVFTLMYAFTQVNLKKFEETAGSLGQTFGGSGTDNKGAGGKADVNLKINLAQKVRLMILGEKVAGIPKKEVEQMTKVGKGIQEALGKATTGKNLSLTIGERGLVISFTGQVLFEKGKTTARSNMKKILSEVGAELSSIDNPIRVEGFTDDLPIKTKEFPSNWELSTARATAVLRYLVEVAGLDPGRLSAAGYGEYKPTYPNTNEKLRALNRKVDVVVLYPSLSKQEPK